MNKRMDYRNKTVNKNQIILKRVFKIIIILLINLSAFTPVFVEKYVNYKRDEWETDRNFFGVKYKSLLSISAFICPLAD